MKVVHNDLISKAKFLSLFTIIYNILEGLISVYYGVEEGSISLLGFGLDSFIEVASAMIVFAKVSSSTPDSNLKHERRATMAIGGLFLLLSLSIMGQSIYQLMQQSHPATTFPGMVISALSLSFMFYLWRAKYQVGFKLDSATIMADARCSLACIKLSVILFVGSILYWAFPQLWWVDAAAALILSGLIFQEGWELVQNARKVEFKGGCGCH